MDYETLKWIWLLIIGVLFIGFAVTGGIDLGVGALLLWIGKNDQQRRLLLNSIGPTWEGNQVWLITAGGALFAAWPFMYAAAFSSFYIAFLVVLLSLILRPPGLDYRSKIQHPLWRSAWDYSLFLSGFIPCLLFGVAFGNIIIGIPFFYDDILRPHPTGTFFSLINPYTLLCGLTSLTALLTHAAYFIQLKNTGEIEQRAMKVSQIGGTLFLLSFSLVWGWTVFYLDGYRIGSIGDVNQTLIPTAKTVIHAPGLWLQHYQSTPNGYFFPALTLVYALLGLLSANRRWPFTALVFNALSLAGIILTVGFTLYPFILPSLTHPNHSLTLWDATSSQLTLTWMLVAVVIFLPIVLMYTSWVFRVTRGKLTSLNHQSY